MIIVLNPNIDATSDRYQQITSYLNRFSEVQIQSHQVQGHQQSLTELYLLGNTKQLSLEEISGLEGVDRVIRISEEYRILGRHQDQQRLTGFTYNDVEFSQDSCHVFAGLCAVDTREHVEIMMRALQSHGQICTRMGAYKPRTNPYSFQGHGKECLPWVFELAGRFGIKVIAMEITHEEQINEIQTALAKTGHPTGVMLQIGTRNTQNFELLKAVGRQTELPVLFKRGFGVSLNESLNAAEYLASEGNSRVIFCLRGMKGEGGAPHRNMVDFAQVPLIKRLTRMPVCVDPSHSVGGRGRSPEGILEAVHAAAQGIVAGANLVLVDFHPNPSVALVDGPQAMLMDELPQFLEDMAACHEFYQSRVDIWAQ